MAALTERAGFDFSATIGTRSPVGDTILARVASAPRGSTVGLDFSVTCGFRSPVGDASLVRMASIVETSGDVTTGLGLTATGPGMILSPVGKTSLVCVASAAAATAIEGVTSTASNAAAAVAGVGRGGLEGTGTVASSSTFGSTFASVAVERDGLTGTATDGSTNANGEERGGFAGTLSSVFGSVGEDGCCSCSLALGFKLGLGMTAGAGNDTDAFISLVVTLSAVAVAFAVAVVVLPLDSISFCRAAMPPPPVEPLATAIGSGCADCEAIGGFGETVTVTGFGVTASDAAEGDLPVFSSTQTLDGFAVIVFADSETSFCKAAMPWLLSV